MSVLKKCGRKKRRTLYTQLAVKCKLLRQRLNMTVWRAPHRFVRAGNLAKEAKSAEIDNGSFAVKEKRVYKTERIEGFF